ncbi:MAG: O-methyltransferase [candidate division Zixibacteria bacterium]|nr:O-methyltransferase [candidate division Zixibacteria bacterium]
MNITHPAIHDYLELNRPPSDPVLQAMEEYGRAQNFPSLGAQCGRLLYALVAISGAQRVFELGSGYGYSMYWMAKAMSDGGMIIGTDTNPDNAASAREYFRQGGLQDKTDLRTGDAVSLFERESGLFDLVVCDIDKHQYPEVFDLAKRRLRPGGMLVADNILWSGRILEDTETDKATNGIREFTRLIFSDPGFFSVIIPIRDGMSLSIKAGE